MLKLFVALSLHVGGSANASDPWFGADKLKHFFMSAFVESVSYSTLRATGVSNGPALVGASVTTLGVGVGKELWDRAGHGDPSLRDLTWDIAGGAAAAARLNRSR